MREQLVPELRFPEFEGEWEEKKLGEVCEIIMGQSPKSENYNDKEIGIPLIQGNADIKDRKTKPQFYTSEITKTCDIGDLILSVRAPVGHISRSEHHACIGRGVCVIKTKQENFIYFYLIRNEKLWKRYEQGSTFTAINSDAINKFSLTIPNPQEQQKIGGFFYKIDKKLELQQEKIDNLKKYKKGMMQRIFSQEIRFKDDNGNDYPGWEEKKLEEIVRFIKNYSYSRNDEGEGKYSHIHYGDIHSRYNGLITKNTVVPKIKSNKEHIELKDGDIIVADASEDYKDLGKTVILLEKGSRNIIASLHTFALRPNEKLNSIYFLNYSYSDSYKQYMYKKGTGISVFGINKKNLENMSILLPSLQEQIKIANFLSSIDKKIELEEEKLEEYKKFKKGLMQRMFI